MKFRLHFTVGEHGAPVRQYWNLKHWLAEHKIDYEFEWENTGHYVPQFIIIKDEQDATMFSLMMSHGEKTRL